MAVHSVNVDEVPFEKSGRGHTKYLFRGEEEGDPTIMIRKWGPDTDIPVHSHPFAEMFYVLEGEIEMGGNVYPAGSCIYIDARTEYGPTRAPKGGTILRYAAGRST